MIKKLLGALFLLLSTITCLTGQANYELQLIFNNIDCQTNTVCYDVQLRSSDGNNWTLAGQNYRLYYDAALGAYQSGTSLLGADYQNFTLVQNIQGLNTTGTGSLAFEDSLSFLNYSIDLNNISTGGTTLPTDGSWLTTSQLCFAIATDLLNTPSSCFEAVWGRVGLTDPYATSFVEISEWVQTGVTQMATGSMYNDLDSSDSEGACFANSCTGLSNYELQLALNNVDCQTNTVCYDVQLRSSDGNNWTLAGQNYRLYYDAALGAYQSGSSLLGNTDYGNFILNQDLQGINTTGTGSLAFEDSLSFLNYSIDLNNINTGGTTLPTDGSWLTTSQLCFTVTADLLNTPSNCFEAVWGRMNLTDPYATSFVEISEWVQDGVTQMAAGTVYNDLESADGQTACLVDLCIYDYGDLPDTSNITAANEYQTLAANNGPVHLITPGLSLGLLIDHESDGQPTTDASGDEQDEDGLTLFTTLNISSGSTFRLPLNYLNTTGNTAHIEAWVDWNGDGDFDMTDEMVLDVADPNQGLFNYLEINVPTDAITEQFLGLRIRLSHQDNMTPYGLQQSGEIEDYLIMIKCSEVCLPIISLMKRGD
ncbi:MAG: GEVED domain-containing protein [Saprospiraceae bacterium]